MKNQIFEQLEMLGKKIEQQNLLAKEILTLGEASIYLGISKSSLYKKTSKNIIPFFKPSFKIIYFKRVDLDEYMLSNRQKTDSEIREKASNFKLNSK